ncbi:unnamed protein product [Callosobruchus maculatus]|uniref:Aminopeptidase n=1 Tax=Callosobruchus maculatus TaxID=64391 RepID=A0A653C0U4_CALMS|nr:unnamed protein product [Callosobruchus maculatus]
MVGYYNQGIPASAELENNSNQKKYTVNRGRPSKSVVISRPLCILMGIGALLLAILVGLVVFFLVPRGCSAGEETPSALTKAVDTVLGGLRKSEDDVDERLPRSIRPTHYRIRIVPYLNTSSTSGWVSMVLKAEEDTSEIIFHARNISIDKHSVTVRKNSSQIKINAQDYAEGDKYKIRLDETLSKGDECEVSMGYTGVLDRHLKGFYKGKYISARNNESYFASTQFSPTDARKAFPCFDEPYFKAKFTISLARPFNMTTLSNMPLGKVEAYEHDKSWYWDDYPETPDMPTYLVAFMVSDLQSTQSTDHRIKMWARNDLIHFTAYAGDLAPKILRYFEEYFGTSFPLPKIDIVAVPEFGFSAMENWGLITFRENVLLIDPATSTNSDKREAAVVLGHEIAHQWFGNLVSPKWWNDLWLKEGFATYLEYFGVDSANPDWKIAEEFLLTETHRAMGVDALESARAISFEVKNSKQIRQAFDDISYAKGACIIRMMNNFLGEAVFKTGLINFLHKYQYGVADREDLFTSLTEEAHKNGILPPNVTVGGIMETWTERPGFPVVHSIADYENNKLLLSQKRFFLSGKQEKSSWWIPISFTAKKTLDENADFSETKPKYWMRGEHQIEEDADLRNISWYLLNVNHTGYFIVNYDEKNWRALSDNIMNLPPLTRAQLISDSMDLASASLISYDIPLRMIARMATQDKMIMIIPTLATLNKLDFLNNMLYNTPAFGLFEEFHSKIFKQTYNIVTQFEGLVDVYITNRIRRVVLEWSCRSSISKCAHEARHRFRERMIHNTVIHPEVRSTVYCTAIREGGDIEWKWAYRRYLDTPSISEKNIILDALGCTKEKWLLSRYLDSLTAGSSIRVQDADKVFSSVAANPDGMPIAFDFLRKNWNALLNRYGDGFSIVAKMIRSLATHMNTEFQLSEFQRFKDSVKQNISTTASAFDAAIEQVRANVNWMNRNYEEVESWLQQHRDYFDFV